MVPLLLSTGYHINVDLPGLFPPGSVDRMFVNFPDPWFKKKHHKRRLLDADLVAACVDALRPGGELFFQSDVWDLSLEALATFEEEARLENLGGGPWSFWRAGNPYGVKSRRELSVEADGLPIGVTSSAPLPIFNGTNRPNVTGEPWRAPIAGEEFNPRVDLFLNRAAFAQPVGQLGNAPRISGDVRRFWNLTENVSVAKTISMTDGLRMDLRLEAFNVFNRIVWGAPNTNLNDTNFGRITTVANSPRQMQLGIKLYW